MLNPALKLNQKFFEEAEEAPTRQGYGEGLLELGEKNPNVVVLSADLTESTKVNKFAEKYPERFFECGVAEQNMAAVAAGLAVAGKIPFISSYATFSPGKNWETIRTTTVYNRANVKIGGHHSGIVTGPDGATHQATEDIAITRCWPKMTVVVPCDAIEAKKATVASAGFEGPVYLRFTRDKTPVITSNETPFELGKAGLFWTCDLPQAVICSTGHLIGEALLAAKELEEEGVKVNVLNISSVKPLDIEGILEQVKKCGSVVSVEDHQQDGGLGGALSEFLVKNLPAPMEFVGLDNTFAESGKPKELIEKYNLGKAAIKNAVKKVIERKGK
ncbi:transketolase family protein [Candidatus Curtissbacteria bacterium]|nr:transketolase family protein [Candidatus Curtissbacteria bacterium]